MTTESELRNRKFNDAKSRSPERRTGDAQEKGSWGGADLGKDAGLLPGRETLGPIALMVTTPPFMFCLWFLMQKCKGDIALFKSKVTADGFSFYGTDDSLIPSAFDCTAWTLILGFMAVELVLMKWMPGKEFRANPTPNGNVPIYTANGMQCFFATLVLTFALMYNKVYLNPDSALDPGLVYDKFGNILSSMNLFALVLCAFLSYKGTHFPSTSDSGSTGNAVIDFYWGTELYPRIFGWDVKTFTNCRFGMMYWAVGICCYAFKQFELSNYESVSNSMVISVVLQLVYIAKFFWWETGYWCSMDIQHDRAGYYICWGCLCWVPSVYTSQSFYLVEHAVNLDSTTAAVNLIGGLLLIWANYDADEQRQSFRKAKGQCLIWGKKPDYIEASYESKEGKAHTSLLLASGWWGISRHVHYIPEILASVAWTVPAVAIGQGHVIPFFYATYLTILLFDRSVRDDLRCKAKYGKFWDQYCQKVPYKVIPGVF